ncbi:MAG: 50S ribosomal protein L21 [Pseudomonadota bacterium]
MYAIIKTGGKQYKVAKDDRLIVEKLPGAAGDSVTFDTVLLVGDGDKTTAGAPLVDGASVSAEVVEQSRADKIIVFKKQRRQNYRRKNGHRQEQTVVRITDISMGGKKASKPKAAKPKAKAAEAAEPEASDAQSNSEE